MKITSRSASTIIIKDYALGNYFLGLLCAGAGAAWLYALYIHRFNILKIETYNLFSAFFVLFGLFIIVRQEITTITFDKLAENISIFRKKLFSSKTENYRFDDLSQIILQEKISRSRKGDTTVLYDIQLLLKAGNLVSLVNNQVQVVKFLANKKKKLEIIRELSDFIGISFKDRCAPSFGQVTELFKQAMINKNIKNNLDNNGQNNYEQKG